MKKVLSLLLVLLLTTALLTGCTSGPDAPPTDHPLIGTWAWSRNTEYVYVFESNGEGTRVAGPDINTFIWSVTDDGGVTMDIQGALTAEWSYEIDERLLTLSSRQERGLEYVFIKTGVAPAPQTGPLVGTWAWEYNDAWLFVFGDNGQGTRGIDPDIVSFEWWTTADGGVATHRGSHVDLWSYTIDGEELTLVSRQEPGVEFTYIRVVD